MCGRQSDGSRWQNRARGPVSLRYEPVTPTAPDGSLDEEEVGA